MYNSAILRSEAVECVNDIYRGARELLQKGSIAQQFKYLFSVYFADAAN